MEPMTTETSPMTPKVTAASILSRIKMVETYLAALKSDVERLMEQEGEPPQTFADLKGMLGGQGNFSEEEIDAALYQLPPGFADEIATLPREDAR